MFDLAQLLISKAWAQAPAAADAAATAAPTNSTVTLFNYIPFLLIILVFYVVVIRPQQKKMVEQEKMIKALKRGDWVVTSGGMHGKVSKLDDQNVTIEVADNVHVKVVRSHVSSLAAKTDTSVIANDVIDVKKN